MDYLINILDNLNNFSLTIFETNFILFGVLIIGNPNNFSFKFIYLIIDNH